MINRPNIHRQDPAEASKAAATNRLNLPAIPMRKPGGAAPQTEEQKKSEGVGFGGKFGL